MTPLQGCSGESSHWNNWALWKRRDSGNIKFLYSSDTHINKLVCCFLLLLQLYSRHSYNILLLNSAVVS